VVILMALVALSGCLEDEPARSIGPACPGAPSIEAQEDGHVRLTWEPVEGTESYPIVRSGPASDQVIIANVTADTTTYLDTNVTPGAAYEYTIHSWNGTAGSTDCPTLEVTTVPFLPGWAAIAAACVLATGVYVGLRVRG
jgi:hypothetical protein